MKTNPLKQLWNSREPFTIESLILDIAFVVVAFLIWGLIAWLSAKAPATIPVHFDAAGTPNGWGTPKEAMTICAVMTVIATFMMGSAHFKVKINMPGVDVQTPRQTQLGCRMMRLIALLMLALTAVLALSTLGSTILSSATATKMMWCCLAAMIAVSIFFIVQIWRAR